MCFWSLRLSGNFNLKGSLHSNLNTSIQFYGVKHYHQPLSRCKPITIKNSHEQCCTDGHVYNTNIKAMTVPSTRSYTFIHVHPFSKCFYPIPPPFHLETASLTLSHFFFFQSAFTWFCRCCCRCCSSTTRIFLSP